MRTHILMFLALFVTCFVALAAATMVLLVLETSALLLSGSFAFESFDVPLRNRRSLALTGRKVPVPAGIGIDPAVGYAPLHTHDATGVIQVESPTVRTYTHGDPTALTLASHQELVVAFGTAAQLPSPIPPTYQFPPGLSRRQATAAGMGMPAGLG